MLHFLKKYKEKRLSISLSKSRWYYRQFLRYRAKHTEIGSFRSFFALLPPKNPKNQNFENAKICCRYYHFTHVYQKSKSNDLRFLRYLEILSFYTYKCTIWFLKYKVRQTEFFVILGHFLYFQPPNKLENQNFKIEKSTWRYYHFTHLHYKWQSYDVWFLRYGELQAEFFVILDRFLPFYPLMNPEHIMIYNCVP